MKATDFSLIGDDDKRHELADNHGKWTVIYFYPADDTPGCTVEACSIRDEYENLANLDVRVYGISMNTPAEHKRFRAKYNLPFTLLSDPTGETIRAYGAWGKGMFGREGIKRQTFIIGPDGDIKKVYKNVTPLGHGAQISRYIKTLQSAG